MKTLTIAFLTIFAVTAFANPLRNFESGRYSAYSFIKSGNPFFDLLLNRAIDSDPYETDLEISETQMIIGKWDIYPLAGCSTQFNEQSSVTIERCVTSSGRNKIKGTVTTTLDYQGHSVFKGKFVIKKSKAGIRIEDTDRLDERGTFIRVFHKI